MILRFAQFNESNKIGSPLLSLKDNIDHQLIDLIRSEVKPSGKILEISCGNGADSLYLQELGYQVVCTEYNSEYVQNAKDLGLDCFLHDTKNEFSFQDKEFDLVYSRLGLHYFTPEELESIFSEINRISKKMLITVKIVDDIKTGKVILTPQIWKEIISKKFDIKKFEIKSGLLYGSQSGWIEILADSIESKLEKVDIGRFEISPCIQVMGHELENWIEFKKREKFSDRELDEIDEILKEFNVVSSDVTVSYKYESKQKHMTPTRYVPLISISGQIKKYSDEYFVVTLREEVFRSRTLQHDLETEYHLCDQIEGLKMFRDYLKNKIKYLKKNLSITESYDLPQEIDHNDALRKEKELKTSKLSKRQIDIIKSLIPVEYNFEVNQGGGWYDLERKLANTSVTFSKNYFQQITIRALGDEYFMIQQVRHSKNSDLWWLCDGFEQVEAWLKERYQA